MNFLELLKIEFMKVKRSNIIPLIFIAPILVVSSGIANLSSYFTPEYCYSGYLVSCSLHDFTTESISTGFDFFPFLPCAALVFVLVQRIISF